ncbi:MAG: nucleoside recognition domain-containing protein [Candidatus Borkfalkia sp.]
MTFGTDFLYLNAIFGFANDVNTGNGVLDAFVAVFYSSEGISTPGAIVFNFMGFITDQIGGGIALGMENAGAAEWAQGLVNDGIWGGLSGILSFIPQILVLFLFISILEDSGYMARVAFILDRAFRKFGLSGRAFIPMIMGFGCSVPAAINTRTLADEKERIMTNRVIPFFTCGAKAPILAAVCGALAAHYTNLDGGLLTFALYVFGMVMAVVTVAFMRQTSMRGEVPPFIMELPAYHAPQFRNLMLHLWDKLKHYIKKAFTIILASHRHLFLSNFSELATRRHRRQVNI